MFGSLKSKFQTVQDGISTSLKGLSIGESSKGKKTSNTSSIDKINYSAGADLLHHFQLQWNELHELAEENATKAHEVDILVGNVYEKLNQQWNNMTILNGTLATIPKINHDIQNLMDQIGSMEEAFEEVEAALFKLEDLNEILELQNKQLDHRFQLALYKEKKLSELDNVRAALASEHSERVLQQELKQQKMLKERQETFDEVFRKEIENYKATGVVPISSSREGPALEEIVLEEDSADFDEFLQS
ncbi:dysbindin protein homolog isoform X2 [Chelonus insularis]|uniref:dysbindin protein homolog isoform X2 n=1 Tax=Chelonus insularis TaxID=460826 RepID=UPI00158BB098|nr:dysbindin protein homolog isoform X2 [Chelonus insularis]